MMFSILFLPSRQTDVSSFYVFPGYNAERKRTYNLVKSNFDCVERKCPVFKKFSPTNSLNLMDFANNLNIVRELLKAF